MLYLTVGALPLYVVRWHYGPLPTTLLETLIIVTVALYVIARWREGLHRPLATPYDIPIAILLLAGAISVVVASDHRAALGLYRAYFLEPVAIFYVAVDLLQDLDDMTHAIVVFAIGSSAFAAINLVVFARALVAHAVSVGAAPNAFYGDANYVAMYLEPPVAMGTGFLLFGQGKRARLLGTLWLAITGSGLLVMFSKGSYAALLGLVLLIILTAPRWGLAVLGALLLAAAIGTQISLVMQRFATITSSLVGRQEIFGAALRMIRDHPVFGLGLGGFSYQFRGAFPAIYPHDIWLTFWIELGILGVVAFAIILIGLLWRGWRQWPSAPNVYRPVLWGALAALTVWSLHGFVDSPYWKNDMSVEFWMLAALQVVVLAALRSCLKAGPVHTGRL
jgi:O-antigen ligase